MKESRVKKDVVQYNIDKNIFLSNDGKINISSEYDKVKYFTIFNEVILMLDKDQKVLNINEFPNIPDNYFYKFFSSSNLYFVLIDLNSLDYESFLYTKEAIYSVTEKKIICLDSVFGNKIIKSYAVDWIGKNKISIFCLQRLIIISFFDLTSLGTWLDGAVEKPYQIAECSGIYNNTLICTMNSGAVLLLDLEKGESKGFFKDTKVRGGLYQIEENNSIFRGLKHYTFIEINVDTGELLRQIDIQNELRRVAKIDSDSPCWLAVGTSIYQDGLFYFYGDKNFVGVFDPEKEEIIDFHWFVFENKQTQLKGGVENLQVKGNEIYCLDTAHNLHVLLLIKDSDGEK